MPTDKKGVINLKLNFGSAKSDFTASLTIEQEKTLIEKLFISSRLIEKSIFFFPSVPDKN